MLSCLWPRAVCPAILAYSLSFGVCTYSATAVAVAVVKIIAVVVLGATASEIGGK